MNSEQLTLATSLAQIFYLTFLFTWSEWTTQQLTCTYCTVTVTVSKQHIHCSTDLNLVLFFSICKIKFSLTWIFKKTFEDKHTAIYSKGWNNFTFHISNFIFRIAHPLEECALHETPGKYHCIFSVQGHLTKKKIRKSLILLFLNKSDSDDTKLKLRCRSIKSWAPIRPYWVHVAHLYEFHRHSV